MADIASVASAADGSGGFRRRVADLAVEPSPNGKPRRRSDDGWLDRWVATVSDLTRLKNTHPMVDAIIEEQRGRRIRIGDQWLADFASCNYLGFDLDEEIIASIPEYIANWGTHPSWSRLLGNPRMYPEIEEQMTQLLDCQDVLVLPTITHIHTSVIPVLVGDGTIFIDGRAHKTIYDGAMYASGHGATIVRFRHDDPDHLAELLSDSMYPYPRVIALDGVNSMTGNAPQLARFSDLAAEHQALLYVDDAHGFGVIGERSPNELNDYGTMGNGVFRHLDVDYDNAVLVAGFSKAYSSLLAFLALPTALKDALKVLAPPYLYSRPVAGRLARDHPDRPRGQPRPRRRDPPPAVAEDRTGSWRRSRPSGSRRRTRRACRSSRSRSRTTRRSTRSGRYLFDHGIYVTMAAYPLVPRDKVGFRIQMTAANDDEQIEELISVLTSLKERFQLHQVATTGA